MFSSRRKAMIRRESRGESRVKEGLLMCEEGQKRQSIRGVKCSSIRGVARAPKLGDTSRTFSLNNTTITTITSSNSSFSNGQCSSITRRRPRVNNEDFDLMEVDSKEEEEENEKLNSCDNEELK